MRLKGTVLLVVAAAVARAADPAPPAQDSISAAKSDLATIKAPQAQADFSQTLQTLDMKDTDSAPGASAGKAAPPGPEEQLGLGALKKKEGTGNWLIDAMDKTDPERAKSKDKADLLKSDSDAISRTENEFNLADPGREKAHAAETVKAPVFNPLDSFMSGWISAKDQDVLLPVSKGEIANTDATKTKSESLQNLDLGPAGIAAEPPSPGLDALPSPESKTAPNPYLAVADTAAAAAQVKGFTAPELPAIGAPEPMDLLHGPTAPEVDTRPVDLTRSFIPDFAQRDDDDKYFKQMKRF